MFDITYSVLEEVHTWTSTQTSSGSKTCALDVWPSLSVARVARLGLGAHLATDVTAPVKRAAAPLPNDVRLGLEPPPAAHQVAAVHPDRGGVALSATCSVKTDSGVVVTEVGRALEVDQVSPTRLLVVGISRVKDETAPSLASHVAFVTYNTQGVNFIIWELVTCFRVHCMLLIYTGASII